MKKSYVTPYLTSISYEVDNVLASSLDKSYVDGDDTIIDFSNIGGVKL